VTERTVGERGWCGRQGWLPTRRWAAELAADRWQCTGGQRALRSQGYSALDP